MSAVVLTLVGRYGTLACLVMRRRREIEIRMAVGATHRHIRQSVVRLDAVLIAAGIPIGLVASLFTSPLLFGHKSAMSIAARRMPRSAGRTASAETGHESQPSGRRVSNRC